MGIGKVRSLLGGSPTSGHRRGHVPQQSILPNDKQNYMNPVWTLLRHGNSAQRASHSKAIMSHELAEAHNIAASGDLQMTKARDEQHEHIGQDKRAPLFDDEELNSDFLDDNFEALRG